MDKINADCPLISCICVTRGKPRLLRRAIRCFETQTYPNRELIILYEDDDLPTAAFLRDTSFGRQVRIIAIGATPKHSLGSLRNIAIAGATGNYICQWDDDDWYHIRRLELQFGTLAGSGRKATLLTRWLVFDDLGGNAYISNKRLWEGSILCDRALIRQRKYVPVGRGEDTPVIDYLKDNHCLHEVENSIGIYIYVCHGSNTWHRAHWEHIFNCSEKLPGASSEMIRDVLKGRYGNAEASGHIDRLLKLQEWHK
jgi:glycosyltransferase involved in cell wall biosynthesis